MQLEIKPHPGNNHPLTGILIKGAAPGHWIREIQQMNLSLAAITVYPVPGTKANTLWGCLITSGTDISRTAIGRNQFCQLVSTTLYIPERSILYPKLSDTETDQLLKGKKHVLHPEFGLVELEEPVDWMGLIEPPVEAERTTYKPAPAVFIPSQIKTFQIKPVTLEEALQRLEQNFPQPEKFKDKPLDPLEKVKLFAYKKLFTDKKNDPHAGKGNAEPSPLLSRLEEIKKFFSGKESNWINKLQLDYEELERRNQKHLDRLIALLKENPAEALKYAIPLDTNGTGRGAGGGALNLQKAWFDFSLFNAGGGSGGIAILPDHAFHKLQQQYRQTARELVEQKDYQKAAFVYMKLLKNYPMAAQTLEEGGFYQEAGTIYLKYCNNKTKAAECFEKGKLFSQAIALYEELNQHEKAGDLYNMLHQTAEAQRCFQKVIDDYTKKDQYIKASLIHKNKMSNHPAAQDLLLQGWRLNKDASNCLSSYFAGIPGEEQLAGELQAIYNKEVNPENREVFLQVLKHQYNHHHALSAPIRVMAHEIIVNQIPVNPSVVSELRAFNKEDKQLGKDALRFRANRKQT